MAIVFNYTLAGHGWAEATILAGGKSFSFDVSYITDPLASLAESLIRLLKNESSQEQVYFVDEPGEHCLLLTRVDSDQVLVEVYWSDEWVEIAVKERELIFRGTDSLLSFARVIRDRFQSLADQFTPAQYEALWLSHSFPQKQLEELKALLEQ